MNITKEKYKEILEIQGVSYNENSAWFEASLERINQSLSTSDADNREESEIKGKRFYEANRTIPKENLEYCKVENPSTNNEGESNNLKIETVFSEGQENALLTALFSASVDWASWHKGENVSEDDLTSNLYEYLEATPKTSLTVEIVQHLNKLGYKIVKDAGKE